ncbi:EXPH5 protein, partial [Smithornis capensis]|nr:EXPH5 protein [Smithornis capensis]
QAEMCNSPMSSETSGHSFDTNQNEMMEKITQEWNEQLEKEFFSVLSDLDDQLAQEQAHEPLDRTVSTSSASNVQSSSAFPTSKRPIATRGQQRNDWSDMPSTFFPDGLRTLRAKDEHKIFIRPRKLHNAYINWHQAAFQEDCRYGDAVDGNPRLHRRRLSAVSFGRSSEGSLYPPSITQNSGFRHKSCMNRDAAGRSYSVCSLRRCPSSVSSDQLSASSLQHPLAREGKNGFVPRFGRQNPKRTPLSSIVWNNTADSPGQTSTPEKMFRTQSLMEFHATDHGRYPSSLQETKKYTCCHAKHHYRRSISSSNCFSRVSCPDEATSPLSFDNWENYPLYKSENNLSRSCYRDISSHGKLYAKQKNSSYGRKDSYSSWADIPQCYSDEAFISPDASFEMFMANLNGEQWAHTKNAKFGSQRLENSFHISPQNGNSENIYMHSFDGDCNTSENSLSYFCLEKGSGKVKSNSPCIDRLHKQNSLLKHTSSCSIAGSPGRYSSKSPEPLVIYYTLPRKSASIAGSIMSDTPISLPRENRATYHYNPEDADLPRPKENAQSPRIQNKENEDHVSLANGFFPTTSEKEDPSYSSDQVSSSLVTPQNLRTAADSEDENSHLSPSSEKSNSQTFDLRLESKSQPVSPNATTSDPQDGEKGRAGSHACTPPLPLLIDKNSNTYVSSCFQADTRPEQNLTSETVLGQCQKTSQSVSLENANINSYQLRKSHGKSQRERHLSESICLRDSLETSASGSNILPKDGIHGKRFKSYSELLSCDENENWASDDEKCYGTRHLMYPSVEFGIFGKEQQLAFLENIKRSLTEGRLWRPCLLNNPGAFRDRETSSINRAELLSSSSAGSKMSSAASSPRELTDIYGEDPAAYSDSDSDTTTDDEYYLDEVDKESEL